MNRGMVIAALVIVAIVIVAAVVLLLSNPSNNPSPPGNQGMNNTNPSGGGQGTNTSTASVSIHDLAFDPTPISVANGTTVTWTNNDSVIHTVTSDPGSLETFESGELAPGATFSHTFNTTGAINYHCRIHPFMHGQVVVA